MGQKILTIVNQEIMSTIIDKKDFNRHWTKISWLTLIKITFINVNKKDHIWY